MSVRAWLREIIVNIVNGSSSLSFAFLLPLSTEVEPHFIEVWKPLIFSCLIPIFLLRGRGIVLMINGELSELILY